MYSLKSPAWYLLVIEVDLGHGPRGIDVPLDALDRASLHAFRTILDSSKPSEYSLFLSFL